MDEIVRLYVGSVTTTETNIINSINGVIIKSVFICNKNSEAKNINFNIDGKDFIFTVESKKTLVINDVIVCNIVNTNVINNDPDVVVEDTNDINIFISGIRLGLA